MKQTHLTRPAANICPHVASEQSDGGPLWATPISAAVDCYLGPLLTRYAVELRKRLADDGLSIEVREGKLYVSPKEKLTAEALRELELARPWLLKFQAWKDRQ